MTLDTDGLRTLADKQAIIELLYRYCRAVDRIDVPLGHSVFHEDATAIYGCGFYDGPARGVVDKICADHLKLLHHTHQIGNILITVDGDRAGSEAYVTATLRGERNGRIFQIGTWSRYVDRWSRRDGRWGIDHRRAIRDFDEMRDVAPMVVDPAARRDGDDPSYAVLSQPAAPR